MSRTVSAWVLSARDQGALRDRATQLLDRVRTARLNPVDVAFSLVTTRSQFEHRAVVLGTDAAELADGLAAVGRDEALAGVVRAGAVRRQAPVFVFPGQGAQWAGMGRDLMKTSRVFRQHLQACEDAMAPYTDWTLWEVLSDPEGTALERVDVVQPALFAVMTSLAALWRAHGVEPAAVVGVSQGEVAAAYAAGALSLDIARAPGRKGRPGHGRHGGRCRRDDARGPRR
jgi:polyketide synthase 12